MSGWTISMITMLLLSFGFSVCAEDSRVIEKTIPAAEIQSLSISGHTGSIRVQGNPGADVVLVLTLKQKKGKVDLEAVKLNVDSANQEIRMDLNVPFDREKLEENWELQIPQKFSSTLTMDVGDIEVEGTSGGQKLKVSVGKIRASSAGGNLEARVGVGDIVATARTISYGDVELTSNVGNVELLLDGHEVKYAKPPGSGNRFRLDGDGRDQILLNANIGKVQLDLAKPAP